MWPWSKPSKPSGDFESLWSTYTEKVSEHQRARQQKEREDIAAQKTLPKRDPEMEKILAKCLSNEQEILHTAEHYWPSRGKDLYLCQRHSDTTTTTRFRAGKGLRSMSGAPQYTTKAYGLLVRCQIEAPPVRVFSLHTLSLSRCAAPAVSSWP